MSFGYRIGKKPIAAQSAVGFTFIVGGIFIPEAHSLCGTEESQELHVFYKYIYHIFQIREKLGEGSMGIVYKAKDIKLDRDVGRK